MKLPIKKYNPSCLRIKGIKSRQLNIPRGFMCEVDFSCELGMNSSGNYAVSKMPKSKKSCFYTCGAVEVGLEKVSKLEFKKSLRSFGLSAYSSGILVFVRGSDWRDFLSGRSSSLLMEPSERCLFSYYKSKRKRRVLTKEYIRVKFIKDSAPCTESWD